MVERILSLESGLLSVALIAGCITVFLPRLADGRAVAVVADVALFVAAATMIALAAATVAERRRRS